MKQRLCTQLADGHQNQSEEYSCLDLLHLLGRTCERGAKELLLIIQEKLEATLTVLHIQLETVERLRGMTEPGGGVAGSAKPRQRKTFQREEPCADIAE